MSDVSLAFNAVGRDRGVSALLTRTSNQVRAANARSAASTIALGSAMAFASARAIALASAAMSAAGAVAAIPSGLAAGAGIVGAFKAVTFGLADAWRATGQAATGGGRAASGAAQKAQRDTRAIRDAEYALADAKREAAAASQAVSKARVQEKERLEDLRRSLSGAKLDEEAATYAVAKAAQDLAKARAGGSNHDIEQADLAYRQSLQTLAETKDQVQDLGQEQAEGARKGVEGSDAVQDAKRREAEANRQVLRAQEQLTDAMTKTGEAAAGAAGGGFDPAAAALAKLSPNGRAVIMMLRQLAPAWQSAFRGGQQAALEGVAGMLLRLSNTYLPMTTTWLVRMGREFNLAIRETFQLATTKGFINDVRASLDTTVAVTHKLAQAVRPIINGFMQWVAVGNGFLPGLADNALTLAQRFERWSIEMRKSGQAAAWIRTGVATLKQFVSLAWNLAMSIVAVVKAGGDGGATLDFLVRGSAAMRKFLESAEGQAKIQQFFAVLRGSLSQAGPLLSSVAANGEELGAGMQILGDGAQFAADHLGPLVRYLPALAAGYLLLKHTGVASGIKLGVQAFQIASQFAMARAIKAHTVALRENTVASGSAAVATGTNTAATSAGAFAGTRAAIAAGAHRVAMVAQTVATRIAAAAQWLWNAAMTANPIGLVIAAIAALVAIVILIATKTDWFQKAWKVAWGAIKAVATITWNAVKAAGLAFYNWVNSAVSGFLARWRASWAAVRSTAGAAWDWVRNKAVSFYNWMNSMPGRLSARLATMWNGLKSGFRAALNWVISRWNNFSIGLPGFSFAGVSVPGFTINTPNIPYLAKGGIAMPSPGGQIVGVAEAGEPEVIAPLSKLPGMLAAAGGGGQVVEVRVVIVGDAGESKFKRWFRESIRVDALLTNAVGTNS